MSRIGVEATTRRRYILNVEVIQPVVVVTIGGVRFSNDCESLSEAVALAERVVRELGVKS